MSSRVLIKKINKCIECPYRYVAEENRSVTQGMGGNGYNSCEKLGRRLNLNQQENDIDPDCPLPSMKSRTSIKKILDLVSGEINI